MNILSNCYDPLMKMHAAIGIKYSLISNWESFSYEEQICFFNKLIQLIIKDQEKIITPSIIHVIHLFMQPQFSEMLFDIIRENSKNLEVCFLLGEILFKAPQIWYIESVQEFANQILTSGFQMKSIKIRLSAVHFLLEASKRKYLSNYSDFWNQSVQLIDECLKLPSEMNILVCSLNEIIENQPQIINPQELSDKLLQFFYSGPLELSIKNSLFSIFHTLCSTFTSYFQNPAVFLPILHMVMTLYYSSVQLEIIIKNNDINEYEDPIPLYENFIDILTEPITPNNIQVLSVIYQISCQISESIQGKLTSLVSIRAMIDNSGTFFDDKLNEISSHFFNCLQSDIQFIREFTLSTISAFAPIFSHEGEALLNFIKTFLEYLKVSLTITSLSCYITLVSYLDSSTQIFDISLQLISSLISGHEQTIDQQNLALDLLTFIIQKSPEKSLEHLQDIFNLLQVFLNPSSPLRSCAATATSILIRTCPQISSLCNLSNIFNFGLSSIDPSDPFFSLTVLNLATSAYDAALQNSIPIQLLPEIAEPLKAISMIDNSSSFSQALSLDSPLPSTGINTQVSASAISLRLLTRIAISSPDALISLATSVIEASEVQFRLCVPLAFSASSAAIAAISRNISNLQKSSTTENFSGINIKIAQVLLQAIESAGDDIDLQEPAFSCLSASLGNGGLVIPSDLFLSVLRTLYTCLPFPGPILMPPWITLSHLIERACSKENPEEGYLTAVREFAEQLISALPESIKQQQLISGLVLANINFRYHSLFPADTKQTLLGMLLDLIRAGSIQALQYVANALITENLPSSAHLEFLTAFEQLELHLVHPLDNLEAEGEFRIASCNVIMLTISRFLADSVELSEIAPPILSAMPLIAYMTPKIASKNCYQNVPNVEIQFLIWLFEKTGNLFAKQILRIGLLMICLPERYEVLLEKVSTNYILTLKEILRMLTAENQYENVSAILQNEQLIKNALTFLSS